MAAIIELKYFNTFWLKKIKSIADVTPGATRNYISNNGTTITMSLLASATEVSVGQEFTISYDILETATTYTSTVVEAFPGNDFTKFVAAVAPTDIIPVNSPIVFGKIVNFDSIPEAYSGASEYDWLIEESRIRGGYNNTSVDYGVKAYLVEDEPKQSHKFSGLIHSGIFNSRTGFKRY